MATARPAPSIVAARLLLAPWAWLTAPRFYGLEQVSADRPALYVGNHTLMGLLDVPLMLLGLWERRGVLLRPLGDHIHFRIPVWREFLQTFGTVEGTPDACRALMQAGESILVFPGGAREVFKRKGEKYRLMWKHRTGFVRLALEHGYPIVPFAALGAEECYDILTDAGDVLRAAPALRRLPRVDEMPPVVRGWGPLPRPQRFYFWFGAPIATAHLRAGHSDERLCLAVRDQVRSAIEGGIAWLRDERDWDPERRLAPRLLAQIGRGLPLHGETMPAA